MHGLAYFHGASKTSEWKETSICANAEAGEADVQAASDAKAAANQKLTEAKAAYDAAAAKRADAAKATELHNYTPTELRAYTQTGGKKRAPRKALFEFCLNSVAMPNAHRPARYACRSTS